MNGYIDNAPLGMICSRQYAEWMLSMNEKLDFPAESYYMLVRLFSRPQYQAFFDEENRKGNNFVYHLSETPDRLICYCSFYNIIETLINDIKKLGLIPKSADR